MNSKRNEFSIGDVVKHYSCGGKLELGIILQLGEAECEVWYPKENEKMWFDYLDLKLIISWNQLTERQQMEINL